LRQSPRSFLFGYKASFCFRLVFYCFGVYSVYQARVTYCVLASGLIIKTRSAGGSRILSSTLCGVSLRAMWFALCVAPLRFPPGMETLGLNSRLLDSIMTSLSPPVMCEASSPIWSTGARVGWRFFIFPDQIHGPVWPKLSKLAPPLNVDVFAI